MLNLRLDPPCRRCLLALRLCVTSAYPLGHPAGRSKCTRFGVFSVILTLRTILFIREKHYLMHAKLTVQAGGKSPELTILLVYKGGMAIKPACGPPQSSSLRANSSPPRAKKMTAQNEKSSQFNNVSPNLSFAPL